MNGNAVLNILRSNWRIIIKTLFAFILGCSVALGIFVTLHDKDLSYEHEWYWYFQEQPSLTMDRFEFRHPDTKDPQVMLQLTYKMMEANRPIHAFALVHKVFDIADEQNDLNLRADAHYTYGTIKFMSPPKQYRFVLEELRDNDPKFKARGINPKSKNSGNLFGDFGEAISLYETTGNLVGMAGTYYQTAYILGVVGGDALYRCSYLRKAHEFNRQIVSEAERATLNSRYLLPEYDTFEAQLIAEEHIPRHHACDTIDFESDPSLIEKGLALHGWRTEFAELKAVSYAATQCREACEIVWKAWLAPIQAKVEVPAYEL